MVRLHVSSLLSSVKTAPRGFQLRTLQLCASLVVRGVFTSDRGLAKRVSCVDLRLLWPPRCAEGALGSLRELDLAGDATPCPGAQQRQTRHGVRCREAVVEADARRAPPAELEAAPDGGTAEGSEPGATPVEARGVGCGGAYVRCSGQA